MSETLTQKDLDALLQGSAPAAPTHVPERDVIPYSFARPPRVSKDRRATLEAIHGRFALSLQAFLSSRLRTPMDVVVDSVEQVTFSEFGVSLAAPCAAFVFGLGERVGGQGIVDLGPELAFYLVDRMLGGPGEGDPPDRALTPLEQTVVRGIVERTLVALRDAWQDQFALEPILEDFQSDPEMLQIANPEDNLLVAILTVRCGSFAGGITLGMPMSALEPFLQDRGASRPRGVEARTEAAALRPKVETFLGGARMTLAARLPAARTSARALARLEPGQILGTGHMPEAEIEIHVNGRLRFLGTLGQVRRRLSLRITRTIDAPGPDGLAREPEGRNS